MIGLILFLVVVGVCLELLKTQLPIDSSIRVLIQVIVVVFVIYMLLGILGIADVPVPHVGRR
jgi:hypothetical protein